jgi:hypothetical protein
VEIWSETDSGWWLMTQSIFNTQSKPSIFSGLSGLKPVQASTTSRIALMAAIGSGRDYRSIVEKSRQTKDMPEDRLREDAGNDFIGRQVTGFTSFLEDLDVLGEPDVAEAGVAMAKEAAGYSAVGAGDFALEDNYVKTLETIAENAEDYTPPPLMDIVGVDFEERRHNTAVNLEIVESLMAPILAERERRNPLFGAAESITFGIPFVWSTSQTGHIGDRPANIVENIIAGPRQREEAREFWIRAQTMSPAEFKAFATNLNESFRQTSSYGGLTNQVMHQQLWEETLDSLPAGLTSAINALDNIPAVGAAAQLVRSGVRSATARAVTRGPVEAIQAAGSRQAPAQIVAAELAAREATGRSALSADELIEAVSPSAARATPTDAVSLAADIEEARAEARQMIQGLTDDLPTRRLQASEEAAAHTHARTEMERRAGGVPLRDFEIIVDPLSDGTTVQRARATFGRADGQGFASQSAARTAASNFGLDPENVVQDISGKWFVRHEAAVDESSFFSVTLPNSARGMLANFFQSARLNAGVDVIAGAQVGELRRNVFIRQIVRPLEQTLRRLDGAARRQLNHIAQAGMSARKWYNREEFNMMYEANTNRRAPASVWNAYQSYRRMNDVEWELRNAAMYREKVTQGYASVSFEVDGVRADMLNGRVFTTLPDNRVVYDPSTRSMRQLSEIPEGHVVVRMAEPVQSADGWFADTFLLRRNQLTERALRYDQLAYSPGGHRMYPANWFVRQTRRGAQPDGSEFLMNPRTFIGVRTEGQARFWAERMNQARALVLAADRQMTPELVRKIDELFDGHQAFSTAREFAQYVEEGRVNLDEAFEVLGDRQLPEAYNNTTTMRFGDPDETAFESWLGSQGRMYYGRKGEEVLPDFTGREGQVLNMQEMMQRSQANVANLYGFGDHRTEMVNRWARTYGRFTGMSDRSPAEIFYQGLINTEDQTILNSAEASRRAIMNVMSHRTPMAQRTDAWTRSVIDRVAGMDPNSWFGKLRTSAATGLDNWHRTNNFQAALTGAAFDMKLGLFNVAQLPLQLSHAMAIASLAPWDSGRVMINSGPSIAYMINGADGILDLLVSNGMHKTLGLSGDDYRAMMRQMRNSGFVFPDNSHILINNAGTSAIQPIREAGRAFFNTGEGLVRGMAFQVGWMETRRKFSTMATDSPEFIRQAISRAHDYSFNMTRASAAFWQQGPLAVPTQFFSYFTRMIEAMTSNQFTMAQRAQLVAGQWAAYGRDGVPLANIIMDTYESLTGGPTGEYPDLETIEGTLRRGLVDRLWLMATGQDVVIGSRFGSGNQLGDIFNSLIGNSPYGETSFAAMAGGASYNIHLQAFGDAADFVNDALQYAASFHGDPDINIPQRSFQRMASNISTFSNAHKAWMIHRFGIYQSGRGTVLIDGVPPQQWLASLLSFHPGETLELSELFQYFENEGEMVQEVSREVSRLNTMMVNDPQNATDYLAQISALLAVQDPFIAEQVRQQTMGEYNRSLYAVMQEQYERNQLRERIFNGTD